MQSNRRTVLQGMGLLSLGALLPGRLHASPEPQAGIRAAARTLSAQGTNAAKAVQDGQAYQFDPTVRYPLETGIVDPTHGHSFYFHAHRTDEYGHFHTFARDEYGLSVHLLMISINKAGQPTALSTVNQWVTDDRHVRAAELMKLYRRFQISPSAFKTPALVSMVNAILGSYASLALPLFEERDAWVDKYRADHGKLPYQDRSIEVISTRAINPLG